MPKRSDLSIELFMSKVQLPVKEEGCWEWMGNRQYNGYGRLRVDGKQRKAHRLSYELFVDPIPVGMCVLHHCDNPGCVRPDHLWLGTSGDNNKDAKGKGRSRGPKGEDHGMSKLSDSQVLSILSECTPKKWGLQRKAALKYGVSEATVSDIVTSRH